MVLMTTIDLRNIKLKQLSFKLGRIVGFNMLKLLQLIAIVSMLILTFSMMLLDLVLIPVYLMLLIITGKFMFFSISIYLFDLVIKIEKLI